MYIISIWTCGKGWNDVAEIDGCEAAYKAFRKAVELCEITWTLCCLVDGETGEVIADNREEED